MSPSSLAPAESAALPSTGQPTETVAAERGLATAAREWWPLALLAVVTWVAHFLHSAAFGLYEDDWWFIGDAIGRDPSYLLDRLRIVAGLPQGRPIGFFLPEFFAYLGDHFGGLHTTYVLGYLVVLLNVTLCWRLLRLVQRGPDPERSAPRPMSARNSSDEPLPDSRVAASDAAPRTLPLAAAAPGGGEPLSQVSLTLPNGNLTIAPSAAPSAPRSPGVPARFARNLGDQSQLVPLAGALLFALFPADSTKALLLHDFQLQPSLTFLLLASLLYLKGHRVPAYVVAVGSLLSYESAYLVLIAVPLLRPTWDRALGRELLRHAAIVVLLLMLAVVVRVLAGEGRAVDSTGGALQILPIAAAAMLLGPIRVLLIFPYVLVLTIRSWPPEQWLVAALSATTLAATFVWLVRRSMVGAGLSNGLGRAAAGLRSANPVLSHPPVRLAVAGLAMLALAYTLSFTHFPPNAVYGRGTSVHIGATLGAAVLFASLMAAVEQLVLPTKLRALAAGALGLYLGLLVGYHLGTQLDFVRSWAIQRAFWADAVPLIPDAGENTIVIYEREPVSATRSIDANSWGDALVLDMAFRFPPQWQNPPRLFSINPGWEERVQPDGASLRWWEPGATWSEHWEPFPDQNVILLRRENGQLVRQTGTITLAGRPFTLKPAPPIPAAPTWPPGRLYATIFGG